MRLAVGMGLSVERAPRRRVIAVPSPPAIVTQVIDGTEHTRVATLTVGATQTYYVTASMFIQSGNRGRWRGPDGAISAPNTTWLSVTGPGVYEAYVDDMVAMRASPQASIQASHAPHPLVVEYDEHARDAWKYISVHNNTGGLGLDVSGMPNIIEARLFNNNWPEAVVNAIIQALVDAGGQNAYLAIYDNAWPDFSNGNIATLQGRGWTLEI